MFPKRTNIFFTRHFSEPSKTQKITINCYLWTKSFSQKGAKVILISLLCVESGWYNNTKTEEKRNILWTKKKKKTFSFFEQKFFVFFFATHRVNRSFFCKALRLCFSVTSSIFASWSRFVWVDRLKKKLFRSLNKNFFLFLQHIDE